MKEAANTQEHNLPAREETHWKKQYFGTRQKLCVAYRPPFLHARVITFQCIQVTDNDRADR